jgi:hypothetical protein
VRWSQTAVARLRATFFGERPCNLSFRWVIYSSLIGSHTTFNFERSGNGSQALWLRRGAVS